MRNVVFVAPYPIETTMRFARALRKLEGVRLCGIVREAPTGADQALYDVVLRVVDPLEVRHLDEALQRLQQQHGPTHRLAGILEPLQVPLAQLREKHSIDGMGVQAAELFRDKGRMKDALQAAGIPCARHAVAASQEDAERFVEEVGFPVVVKPPAGMACKATWRLEDGDALRQALAAMAPSEREPLLVEEFLRGREHSYDTICVDGEAKIFGIGEYQPSCLEVLQNPWIQWRVVYPREADGPDYEDARALGGEVLAALGMRTGFTHMEWFRRDDGSLAVGEIAARPPGAQFVRLLGLAHDCDLYEAWARATVDEEFDAPTERRFSVGCAYLRGIGRGRVLGVDGVEASDEAVGAHIVEADLPTLGAPKNHSYEGDGYAIARHPDTEVVRATLRHVIENVRVRYG